MNDRIQELAVQAGEYVNSVYTPPIRSKTPGKIWEDGHIGWHTQFNQKFAELIVRECMEWCDAHATIDGSAQQIRNSIKNYFGVE